jgi:FixJ family two-component response regulator
VEVLRSYANRADLLEDLRLTANELAEAPNGVCTSKRPTTDRQPAAKRLCERLRPEDVQTILAELASGTRRDVVAARFGISVRSVARLRKKHAQVQNSSNFSLLQ